MDNVINPSHETNYYDRDGNSITSSNQPTVNSGRSMLVGSSAEGLNNVSIASSLVTNTANINLMQGVLTVSLGSGVAATSVTGSVGGTSGYCKFSKTGHGLSVGDKLWLTGATANSIEGIHVVTVANTNDFTTDRAYEASATAGTYYPVNNTANLNYKTKNIIIKGQQNTLLGTSGSTALLGNVGLRAINNVVRLYVRQIATAIRGNYYNMITDTFDNTYPANSTNQTYNASGTAKTDGSIGQASNPTSDAYAAVTYLVGNSTTTTDLDKNLW